MSPPPAPPPDARRPRRCCSRATSSTRASPRPTGEAGTPDSVGNARTVHVKDTIATLERTGGGPPTPVDAIRLHGIFGPFVAVRQTSVRNFGIGVRVEPL